MPLLVTSTADRTGLFVTIFPVGSLDSNTYPILESHLAELGKSSPRALVFDLKGLTYISSAGVRVFVSTKKAMKAADGEMILTNVPPQIRKVFEIIQALPSLNVFENVEELDRYLAGIQQKIVEEGETK